MPRIVAVADLHCGSTLGLCPGGGAETEDGGWYEPSELQDWLWEKWLAFWNGLSGVDLVLLVGDLVDGDVKGTTQRWTRNLTVQAQCAARCVQAVVPAGARILVFRGTPAHVRSGGEGDDMVAAYLGAEGAEYRRRLVVHGVLLDVSHYVSASGRRHIWTEHGIAQRIVADFLAECARWNEAVPDLVIRGHAHGALDSGPTTRPRVLILPAWQLATEYIQATGTPRVAPVGGVVIDIEPGRDPEVRWKLYRPDPVPVEKIL